VTSTVGGPALTGRQVSEDVIAPQPDPSTMAPSVVMLGGSSSGVSTSAGTLQTRGNH
jgi:hypothetical protein